MIIFKLWVILCAFDSIILINSKLFGLILIDSASMRIFLKFDVFSGCSIKLDCDSRCFFDYATIETRHDSQATCRGVCSLQKFGLLKLI